MIYFDNAATTYPKPQQTLTAMNEAMRVWGANPGRSGHRLSAACAEKVYGCREKAARLFGCGKPENVIFTANCTHAVNLVTGGLLQPGDHVVISDWEHNAVLRPIHHLAEQGIITYSVAETFEGDDAATVNSFAACMRPNTRLVVAVHASNVSGAVLPIEGIARAAHAAGAYMMVDGAQSGGVLPIHMQQNGIDFLCLPGHKGLYGPMGTGLLLTAVDELPRASLFGGTGSSSLDDNQPDFLPDRLESGTLNAPGIIALSAGLDFVEQVGIDNIRAHENRIARYLVSALSELSKGRLQLYGAEKYQGRRTAVISFNLRDYPGEKTAALLNEQGIAVRGGYQCAPLAHKKLGTMDRGSCRISIGAFNNQYQAEQLIRNIKKILTFA